MDVRWTDVANAELDAVHDRLARWSEKGAEDFVARVTLRVRQLADFPFSGRVIPEYGYPQLRELIERDYRLLYHVLPDGVEILGLMHGSRELPGLP